MKENVKSVNIQGEKMENVWGGKMMNECFFAVRGNTVPLQYLDCLFPTDIDSQITVCLRMQL